MEVYLNAFPLVVKPRQVYVYGIKATDPDTKNRSIKFRLIANIAKRISKNTSPVFSVGDQIFSTNPIALKHEEELDVVAGTSFKFGVELEQLEQVDLAQVEQGPERLVNRLVDWYYREKIPQSFHMEDANYVGQNIFARLEGKYYRRYKINVNEGMKRTTRIFGGKPYLLLDADYRVTWEETLWDNVKNFVQKELAKNVYLPDASTIRAINEEFGATGKNRGRLVQGKNNVGEYNVLEFDFTKNPDTPGTAGTMSQAEFFEKVHGLTIADHKQPLVRVRVAKGFHWGKENYHVPELLVFDRMPDQLRSNDRLMSALSNITKPEPRGRFGLLLNLTQGDPFGKTTGFSKDEFVGKFVQVPDVPVVANAETLQPYNVRMGKDAFKVVSHQDFLGKILKKKFHRSPEVKKVGLLYLKQKEQQVSDFYGLLGKECAEHGLVLPNPKMIPVGEGEETSYREAMAEAKGLDLALSFTAYLDDEAYESIKQELLLRHGVLSQNISYERTLDKVEDYLGQKRDHEAKVILTMIAIQLCAKMGGSPWAFFDPIFEENYPILGLDVYHSIEGDEPVVGACAAFDPYGEYLFSSVTDPQSTEEALTTLKNLLRGVLGRYVESHGTPDGVLIIRDGLNHTQEQEFMHDPKYGELAIIADALAAFNIKNNIVVMEKKNTLLRMYKKLTEVRVENPDPGTVVIGSPFGKSEMLMVSQEIYKGTADPVLYKVITPTDPEMDKIAYAVHKLCRHHWNTPVSIRIPAPAFHADKIEYLVRRVLKRSPTNPIILDRPFYL